MSNILILEDDLDIRKIYSDKFRLRGIKTIETDSGEDALRILSSQPIDLLLLDIVLPRGMSGIEVLKKIRNSENLKDLPVVVLTNYDTEKDVAGSLNVKDYVLKASSNPTDVVDRVLKNLEQH